MNHRIGKRGASRIVGAKEHYDLKVEENFTQILGLLNQEPKGILGVTSSMKGKEFDY